MKRFKSAYIAGILSVSVLFGGCGQAAVQKDAVQENKTEGTQQIQVTSKITELEKGFSAVEFTGDDGLEGFLNGGGAKSDSEVIAYLTQMLSANVTLDTTQVFGCSTLAVSDNNGNHLFGRNFDWDASCDALVVVAKPVKGYASISTVNTNFISASAGVMTNLALKNDELLTRVALYAPLDGMNEKGFAVSVNMISDSARIEQNTDKPDLTTTTAIRLLLNQAATVDEAVALLRQYDVHGSMGMMIHLHMTDVTGKSVVVEYVNQQMQVIESPIATNFYLAEGEKYGIGTAQSHQRFERLQTLLGQKPTLDAAGVKDALDSVSKDNYTEYESTEWSAVFHLNEGITDYYHREDYNHGYTFSLR